MMTNVAAQGCGGRAAVKAKAAGSGKKFPRSVSFSFEVEGGVAIIEDDLTVGDEDDGA